MLIILASYLRNLYSLNSFNKLLNIEKLCSLFDYEYFGLFMK